MTKIKALQIVILAISEYCRYHSKCRDECVFFINDNCLNEKLRPLRDKLGKISQMEINELIKKIEDI
ncbi:MAG: hypothetical protein EAX96_20835 [Candidatus Lokiarchaeota archaeon]|nr:hypothetical protein [Candidatus Lokiarchaeota archaeon]